MRKFEDKEEGKGAHVQANRYRNKPGKLKCHIFLLLVSSTIKGLPPCAEASLGPSHSHTTHVPHYLHSTILQNSLLQLLPFAMHPAGPAPASPRTVFSTSSWGQNPKRSSKLLSPADRYVSCRQVVRAAMPTQSSMRMCSAPNFSGYSAGQDFARPFYPSPPATTAVAGR